MPKFYLYRKQQGQGCDYTIGCGMWLAPLDVDSIEAAVKECLDDHDLAAGDEELSEAMIFAAPVHVFDLSAMKSEARRREADMERTSRDLDEKAEFERLQKKFEKERY